MDIVEKMQDLSDLELAMLLCFMAEQHALLIYVDQDRIPDVAQELESVNQYFLTYKTKG